MLIREISLETRLRKKLQLGNFFLAKGFFLSIWMCTFRIWPLEAVIMQAKPRLSHKKL